VRDHHEVNCFGGGATRARARAAAHDDAPRAVDARKRRSHAARASRRRARDARRAGARENDARTPREAAPT